MARMKISGPTQGKLIFAYDIRAGHLNYQQLIPTLNRRLVLKGIKANAEEGEIEDIVGEILFRCNERIFDNINLIISEEEYNLDIEKVVDEAIEAVLKK